jgi:hypothetical protein
VTLATALFLQAAGAVPAPVVAVAAAVSCDAISMPLFSVREALLVQLAQSGEAKLSPEHSSESIAVVGILLSITFRDAAFKRESSSSTGNGSSSNSSKGKHKAQVSVKHTLTQYTAHCDTAHVCQHSCTMSQSLPASQISSTVPLLLTRWCVTVLLVECCI